MAGPVSMAPPSLDQSLVSAPAAGSDCTSLSASGAEFSSCFGSVMCAVYPCGAGRTVGTARMANCRSYSPKGSVPGASSKPLLPAEMEPKPARIALMKLVIMRCSFPSMCRRTRGTTRSRLPAAVASSL